MSRKNARMAILGVALAALVSGCSEAPADGDCAKLHAHLVELEVNTGAAADADKAKHKTDLAEATRKTFIERCESNLKAKQVSCSLKSTNAEELEACDS